MFAYLFNPENDIALAAGSASYTPPVAAVEMRRAGELLPLFLAGKHDAVITEGVNREWFDAFRERFDIESGVWNHDIHGFTPRPWGWSAAVRRRFEYLGFPLEVLPSGSQLEKWRMLSHRRTAATLAQCVRNGSDLPLWPEAVEVDNAGLLKEILSSMDAAVVKSPWSSSGRGVSLFSGSGTDSFVSRMAGTIRRQGSVMVEEYMEGHRDFALLFECEEGKAVYVGPSVFMADPQGNYSGNMVADESGLYSEIYSVMHPAAVKELIDALRHAVQEIIAPGYSGPVGIDICCSPGGKIHICEANLRYTMGFVARGIALRSGFKGILGSADRKKVPGEAILLTQPGTKIVFYLSQFLRQSVS